MLKLSGREEIPLSKLLLVICFFINLKLWIFMVYCFLHVVKDESKICKNSILNTFEESTISDESLYGYHRKCYQEYTYKQKFQRMVANKQVGVKERKSGRESRIGGTCNTLLNSYSLLKETCIWETLQLSRTGEFTLNYCN